MTDTPRWRRWLRRSGIVALFAAAAMLGTAGGVLFAYSSDLPQITALDHYAPGTITRVVGRDGALVGEFATERRQIVSYQDIPEVLRHAIMAAEDQHFMTHGGFHPMLMAYAAVNDLVRSGRTPGRSTITQQLARQVFPDTIGFERAWIRKMKEALVALQIEKRYTKEEIFAMYCNKAAWGHGTYGVEAASQLYFAKPAKDLTLSEAATIAGMLPAPQRLNPYTSVDASTRRRNYTLARMVESGFITEAEAAEAREQPVAPVGDPVRVRSAAPHFLEHVRGYLDERYGSTAIYEGGLTVRTGLDVPLQRAAHRAMDAWLRDLDKRRGFRRPERNILDENRALDTYRHPRWTRELVPGDVVPAVVMAVEGVTIRVRVNRQSGTIGRTGYAWTRRRAADLVRAGDLVEVRVGKAGADGAFDATLEQPPQIEGAVVAVDNHTGDILAMVGGTNFERSQFNRAVQAKRQVGSLFKPFVYMAAIDRGYTAASNLVDTPMSFDAGPNQPLYEPRNYDRDFLGPLTLRRALELSRNIPAVALMQALGPAEVNQYPRRLGITTPLPEFLSVAIGSAEGTLLEMTAAYAAMVNQGVRMTPSFVQQVNDREGAVLERSRPEPHEAVRADTAYIIVDILRGAAARGTASTASSLRWPVGGKTGTTNDYTDAWFIGFDPDITLGVWIGYDQKRTIGDRMTGTTAALPVWIDIMKTWVARRRTELKTPPEFPRPGNVITVPTIDGPEVFIIGTEPGGRGGTRP